MLQRMLVSLTVWNAKYEITHEVKEKKTKKCDSTQRQVIHKEK